MIKNGRYTYIEKTTIAGENILEGIFDKSFTHPVVKKITIAVDQDCMILINGLDRINVKPYFGLTLGYEDISINSLVTETDNVSLYAVIAY